MIAIEDCVELAVRGLKVFNHGSEERLLQAGRGDRVHALGAVNILKKNEERENTNHVWLVFETG